MRFGAQALASRQTPDATPPIKRPSELGRVMRVGDVSETESVLPTHGCVCGERCVSALSRAHSSHLDLTHGSCLGNSVGSDQG